jgi:hypothetical protein
MQPDIIGMRPEYSRCGSNLKFIFGSPADTFATFFVRIFSRIRPVLEKKFKKHRKPVKFNKNKKISGFIIYNHP